MECSQYLDSTGALIFSRTISSDSLLQHDEASDEIKQTLGRSDESRGIWKNDETEDQLDTGSG